VNLPEKVTFPFFRMFNKILAGSSGVEGGCHPQKANTGEGEIFICEKLHYIASAEIGYRNLSMKMRHFYKTFGVSLYHSSVTVC
jgi:hypothetical protein